MQLISHRGFWQDAAEKNQRIAFERSITEGFGIETDIRDSRGTLVISHDMPRGSEMTLSEFLDMVGDTSIPLAMNIKADGLVALLKAEMAARNLKNWFVFDMSVPDTRGYLQHNLPVFTRLSEVETAPAFFDESVGVWLDEFKSTWYRQEDVAQLLGQNKKVCIVSPELHGRDPHAVWEMLLPLATHQSLMLCTDFPDKAKKFFGA